MKPIQIMMDENLLKEFDEDGEVRRFGRSSVLRRITAEYLEDRGRTRISEQYKRAYESKKEISKDELRGWEKEGIWPEQ